MNQRKRQYPLRIITIFSILFLSVLNLAEVFAQVNKFYELENDKYSIEQIVSSGDSVFFLVEDIASQPASGIFMKLDSTGKNSQIIQQLDFTFAEFRSLGIRENTIYGTTRFKVFKYELNKSTELSVLVSFSNQVGQDTKIISLSDSTIWGVFRTSNEDNGSIFNLSYDGSFFEKIYQSPAPNPDFSFGQNPSDIAFNGNSMFVAFLNGGGIPYSDGLGGRVLSGSVGNIDISGQNLVTILQGQDIIGTNPSSLVVYNNQLYGLWLSSGRSGPSRIFRVNFDGSNYTELGFLPNSARGDLVVKDDKLFGITASTFYSYDLINSQLEEIVDFAAEMDILDIHIGPIPHNEGFLIGYRKSGIANNGGVLYYDPFSKIEEVLSNQIEDTEVVIYPNPSRGVLSLRSSQRILDVEILDLAGKKIDFNKTINQGTVEISIRDAANGIYLLEITTARGVYSQKVNLNRN